jgi:hypothetical protein
MGSQNYTFQDTRNVILKVYLHVHIYIWRERGYEEAWEREAVTSHRMWLTDHIRTSERRSGFKCFILGTLHKNLEAIKWTQQI